MPCLNLTQFGMCSQQGTGSSFEWRTGSRVHGADMVRECLQVGVLYCGLNCIPKKDESRTRNIVQWLSICLDCVRLRFNYQHWRICL